MNLFISPQKGHLPSHVLRRWRNTCLLFAALAASLIGPPQVLQADMPDVYAGGAPSIEDRPLSSRQYATAQTGHVTLPTYPLERYQTDAFDPVYRWPYKKFDVERFRIEAPKPTPRTYRLLVLENAYLRVLLLPELGGRIWQVIHKPSGAPMFYQNNVVKPTHWGQPNQLGWLALGGLEWGLPVIEHGYDWGVPWAYTLDEGDGAHVAVTFTTPDDGRLLRAEITVALTMDAAVFTVEPKLTNVSNQPLAFSFWMDALLAPGSGQRPSEQLRFVLPTYRVTLHSTNDAALPSPRQSFPWPRFAGRDWSRLGNWRQYLGFFENPAAHGPFTAVYDPAYDVGAVRIFPPDVARGSKVFGLGWGDALAPDNYTDDNSMYVELHGGLAPTFFDRISLDAGQTITWRETWYPAKGIGGLVYASEAAALNAQATVDGLHIGVYPTQPLSGVLVMMVDDTEQLRLPVQADPATPFNTWLHSRILPSGRLTVRLEDRGGQVLLAYQTLQ
jgi:hypothetical protein